MNKNRNLAKKGEASLIVPLPHAKYMFKLNIAKIIVKQMNQMLVQLEHAWFLLIQIQYQEILLLFENRFWTEHYAQAIQGPKFQIGIRISLQGKLCAFKISPHPQTPAR